MDLISEVIKPLLTAANSYEPLLIKYGLVIIFAAILVEGFGIPTPGQSLLIIGALLSTRGEFDIRLLLTLAWFAAVAGNTLGYFIGKAGGRRLLLRLPINPSRLKRMDDFCRRYGMLLVILSRFIDGPRQLTGIFVGSLQMSFTAFLLATSLGALLWVGFWGIGSYYLGQHMHTVAQAFASIAPFTWLVTGLLILVLCIYLIRKHNHQKSSPKKY